MNHNFHFQDYITNHSADEGCNDTTKQDPMPLF